MEVDILKIKFLFFFLESSYKTGLDDVRREITLIKNLSHPNIIKLVEIIEDLNGHNLYLSLFMDD